jgi:hypothetical protein
MSKKQHGELETKTCPYCGDEIKVYRRHLPCDGVESVEAGP